MKLLIISALTAFTAPVATAPIGSPIQCPGLSIAPLEHSNGQGSTFASNDQVVLKWTVSGETVTYISEIDLYSAKNNQFLHTQYRSYPGVNVASGQISLTLNVPLCLQRDGSYYLGIYSTTASQGSSCFTPTPEFQLTPDPNGNFTVCS